MRSVLRLVLVLVTTTLCLAAIDKIMPDVVHVFPAGIRVPGAITAGTIIAGNIVATNNVTTPSLTVNGDMTVRDINSGRTANFTTLNGATINGTTGVVSSLHVIAQVAAEFGFQHKRVSGCTTADVAGVLCATNLTWTVAEPDVNYTALCTCEGATNLPLVTIFSRGTSGLVINTTNLHATGTGASGCATLDCLALHD